MRRQGWQPMVWIAALATVAIGAWLLVDSLTYTLLPADPVAGRVRGCYTAVERWIGVGRPSLIREGQLIGGAGTIALAAFWFLRRPLD